MAAAEKIKQLAEQLDLEEKKFEDKGNAAAGARARKVLQEIRVLCGTGRKEIQDQKNAA